MTMGGRGKKPKSTNKSKRRPSLKARSPRQSNLLGARLWGRTEKIQRRNRKTWTRKFAKEGRQLDKAEVQAGISLTEDFKGVQPFICNKAEQAEVEKLP
jgi:hypothetical protein